MAATLGGMLPRLPAPLVLAAFSLLAGGGSAAAGNDAFADRVPLSGASASAVTSAFAATKETDEPNHAAGNAGGSSWWSWTAPSTGLANFSTFGGAAVSPSDPFLYGPNLAVYTGGTLGGLTEIGSTNQRATGYYSSSFGVLDTGVSLSVPVVAGQVYQIAFATGVRPADPAVLSINRPPTIVSGAVASAVLGAAFSYQIQASGIPAGFSASGLPGGLSVNPFTGLISGSPVEAGVFVVPLEASNSAGTGGAILTLNVIATAPPVPMTPPVFYGDAAAGGTVGAAFSYYAFASGLVESYTVGALPPGLVFNTASARLSGVPTASGVWQVNLGATNSAGTSSAVVTIVIAAAPLAPVITSSAAKSGTVGVAFSYTVAASNSPVSFSASNLPPGFSFVPGSGVISGVPAGDGIFTVPIAATNAGGTGTATLTIAIAPAAAPVPVLQIGSSATASGVVGTAFTYLLDGGNAATAFTASGLPPGLSFNAQNGYITGTPTAAGVFTPVVTASDGSATVSASLRFTITATAPAAATVSSVLFTSKAGATGVVGTSFYYAATTDSSSYSTTYSATGLPSGLGISSTGVISGTPTFAGTYSVALSVAIPASGGTAATSGSAVVTIRILAAQPAPTEAPLIMSSASATGVLGASFSHYLSADGSPTAFDASGLPAGLAISATTGAITGTPSVTGFFPVALSATNAVGTGTAALALTIAATPAAPVITSDSTVAGAVGVALSTYTIPTTPAATSYAAGGLPAGLAFDAATGRITGTPMTAGIFTVPFSATNAGGTTSAVLTITVAAAPAVPVVSSATAATGRVGSSFSYYVSASNSPSSYAASNLPAGLSISTSSGAISGTPTVAGTFAVPISATNAGSTGSATLTLTIGATGPAPIISAAATAPGNTGTPFIFSLSASNSPTSYTASDLPPGLSVNTATGALSGTPTTVGVYSVPFSATNAGGTASATLTVTIAGPAAPAAPLFTSSAAVRALVGLPFSHTLTASGAPTAFTATGLPAGLSLNAATGAITGTPGAAGVNGVAISATNSGGTASAVLTIQIAGAPTEPPVVTSSAGVLGAVGEPFFYAVTASNAPTTFATTALPAGLSLDAATGIIAGTPVASATTPVTLTAGNVNGNSTGALRIAIGTVAAPRISSSAAVAGVVGTAFSYTIAANRSASSYSAPGLPAGLVLNTVTGVISGTPTTAATSSVTLSANTSVGTGSSTLKIVIGATSPTVPVVASAAGMNAAVGDLFGYRIMASNGPTSFAATGLPAGLSLNAATGWVTGVPTAAGTFTVTLMPSNSFGAGSASLKIVVAGSPLTGRISSAGAAGGLAGAPFTYRLTATGSPFSYAVTSALPAGLTFSGTTNTITGVPASAGLTSLTVVASTSGGTVTGTVVVTIAPIPLAAPVITSAAAARGPGGVDFTYAVAATNLPTAFAATGLPPGLAIDAASGLIYGRPTGEGIFAATLAATNARGQGPATVTFTISAGPPPPVMGGSAAVSATVGVTGVIVKIAASNNPDQFTASGLPPGLSLDSASGAISGTPTTAGVYAGQISASNSGGTATATLTFTVAPPAAPAFYSAAAASGIAGFAFSSYLSASGGPTAYGATGLPPGLVLNASSGAITGMPSTAGTFPVQITASNAAGSTSAIFTIAIAAAPPPPPIVYSDATAGGEVGSPFSYAVDATEYFGSNSVPATFGASGLPLGLSLDTASGEVSGTPTVAGTFPVTVSATNVSGTSFAQVAITIAPTAAPAITSALGATGYTGHAFAYYSAVSHTAGAFGATGLPPGLNVNGVTGLIAGSPTAAGEYLVTLTASNGAGAGGAQVRIRILAASTATPVITSAASALAPLNNNYSYQYPVSVFSYTITGAGFPSSFTASGLPAGLSLNPWTGAITGRPTGSGIFQVPVSATSAAGTATATLTIVVPVSPPTISTAASVIGHVGVALTKSFTSNSSSGYSLYPPNFPITYAASGLPPVLSVNTATGVISGTPTAAGSFLTTLAASDVAGAVSAPLTFLIDNIFPAPTGPRFVTAPAAQGGALGVALTYDFWVDGRPDTLAASGLPPGLSFSTPDGILNGVPTKFGRISGTPTFTATYAVPMQAQNAAGSARAVATLVIAAAPAAPVITSDASERGTVGVPFYYYFYVAYDATSSGSPIAYAAVNLPPGLTLDSAARRISGVPTAAGTFAVPVSATLGGATGKAIVTFTVAAAPAASATVPALSAAAGALGFVGVPFQFSISASGTDELTVAGLPPGLSAAITDGTLGGAAAKFATVSGFPTGPGTFAIPVSAHNAFGTAGATVTVTIVTPQAAMPYITQQPATQSANQGDAVVFTVAVTGLPAPAFQWRRDGAPLAGATSATLTLPVVTTADAASYTVTVGNSSGSAISAAAVLTVVTSYAQWQAAHFSPEEIAGGAADATGDFNGDGVANLLEYAFARDPRTGAGGALPTASRTGAGGRLRLAFTRETGRADLHYVVEASDDLAAWSAIASSVSGAVTASIGPASSVSESGGVLKSVTVEDAQDPATSPGRFLRLRITHP